MQPRAELGAQVHEGISDYYPYHCLLKLHLFHIARAVDKSVIEDDDIDMNEDEIISLLQEYDTDYVCIADCAIALADSEQMVCEIEIDEDGHLIMLDEEGDGIVGNITPDEWEQIKEAIEDTLG